MPRMEGDPSMRGIALLTFPILALALGGCVARTAVNVATAPVRVAGKAVDLATTSQSERDEKRGLLQLPDYGIGAHKK